jgi:hypothetical protein
MIYFIELDNGLLDRKIFARVDDDGLMRYTCSEDDEQYQLWLKNQNN